MVEMEILKYSQKGTNRLGQMTYEHQKNGTVSGYLDLLSGSEKERANALEDSSHIFITKQIDLSLTKQDRLSFGSQVYEVTYIDNPVHLNHHLEIYLKVVA